MSPTDPEEPAPETGKLLILLCTYNERDNLERLIPAIFEQAPSAELLVVDDGSPDGTSQLVRELAETDARIQLIERSGKLGLGSAVIVGFEYAIEHGYESLLTLDADLSHPPRFIPDLLALRSKADVVIGSRYVPGGGIVGWGLKRKLMSWGINWYSRLLLGLPNKDNSGNFRCYRVSRLAELDLTRVRSSGYSFMEEILFRCRRLGCTFAETPIVFEDRQIGESKINLAEVIKAIWIILRLFFDRILRTPVRRKPEAETGKP
ncbi:MAG TPA: polyprenol monophosphomannose synthase [Planctomycetaceae bacterium]|nr:polyprenol monophosphomannose synthase [Planctomycetaceae bacterium]